MKDVVIVAAKRTAVGTLGGTIKNVKPEDLSAVVVKGILDEIKIQTDSIDEVILGHCRQSSDNPNIARIVALKCGLPDSTPAYTVMRQCASGMQAVHDGMMAIMTGHAETVIAGGCESMSMAPFYIRGARFGMGTGNTELLDSLVEAHYQSQPQETYGKFSMGMTAENVAEKMNISREDQDQFAFNSQMKAANAIKSGRFKDEIIPVVIPQRKKDAIIFDTDEFPRASTLEALSKLSPVFKKDGTVTAGNASGRNDGASALLLMSEEKAKSLKLKPLAKIKSVGVSGIDPRLMGLGPVEATKKALKRAELALDEIDLIELNEAFAAQSLGCIRELGLDESKVNVNGGAIALGHPVGSSGSRILVTLVHEMIKQNARYGLATLCIAGGMGMAMILERADG